MRCRLCGDSAVETSVDSMLYSECGTCGYVAIDTSHFLSEGMERSRYLLHKNDLGDSGYRNYLETFIHAMLDRNLPPEARILDFGSGPSPALSELLAQRGWKPRPFDAYFTPKFDWEAESWDAIVLHEVAEHLREPNTVLPRLARALRAGGFLAIRTRFLPPDRQAFSSWWYRRDPTHVGFFAERSIGFIAEMTGLQLDFTRQPDLALLSKPSTIDKTVPQRIGGQA